MQETETIWTSENKKISEEPVSLLRVQTAIEELSQKELLQLKKYATWRMRSLGEKTAGLDPEDLLSEAISLTLSNQRVWKEGIPFLQHLIGAMRSISTAWREKFVKEPVVAVPDFEPDSFTETRLQPERIFSAKEQLARIMRLFSEDLVALQVIEQLGLGYSAKEIEERLHLRQSELSAAVKRIRRKLDVDAQKGSESNARVHGACL